MQFWWYLLSCFLSRMGKIQLRKLSTTSIQFTYPQEKDNNTFGWSPFLESPSEATWVLVSGKISGCILQRYPSRPLLRRLIYLPSMHLFGAAVGREGKLSTFVSAEVYTIMACHCIDVYKTWKTKGLQLR